MDNMEYVMSMYSVDNVLLERALFRVASSAHPMFNIMEYGSTLASNPAVPTFFAYSKNAVRLGTLLT